MLPVLGVVVVEGGDIYSVRSGEESLAGVRWLATPGVCMATPGVCMAGMAKEEKGSKSTSEARSSDSSSLSESSSDRLTLWVSGWVVVVCW